MKALCALIMPCWILLKMKTFSDKWCRENQITNFIFKTFFFKSCRLWDNLGNVLEPDRPQMTVWRIQIVCCIPKTTNTLSESVIFIVFPPQHWLHERTSALRYIYIACLVKFIRSYVFFASFPYCVSGGGGTLFFFLWHLLWQNIFFLFVTVCLLLPFYLHFHPFLYCVDHITI